MKKGLVKKGDNLQVDHTKPLGMGGKATQANTRVVPASQNESFRRNSKGGIVSQISKKEAASKPAHKRNR